MDMRSVAPMKTAKIGYIVMSVLFCVLGVVLLFTPGVSALWIGRLLGIGLILFGAIKLVGYFSRDLFRLAFQYDLAFGLLLMVLGIVTLSHPGDALSFLCVMFGIPVLADGLFKIQIAMDSRQFGIRNWWLVLVLAALTCVVGVVLARDPNSSVFGIVSFAWAGFGGAYGAVMLCALFWKRCNWQGALAGMLSGGLMVFVWKYLISPLGGVFSIYELLPAFLTSLLVCVVVSLVTPAPSAEIEAEFEAAK